MKSKSKTNTQYMVVPLPFAAPSSTMLYGKPKTDATGKTDTTYYNNPTMSGNARRLVTNWAHYVHVNTIIENKWFFFDNPEHRKMVSLFHDFYHAYIYKVAKALTTQSPRFVRKEAEADDPEPPEDETIAKEWDRLNLTAMLRSFIEQDRIHGWAIYAPFKTEVLPKYFTGNPWNVFSACEAKEDTDKRDRFGHPTLWKVQPANAKLPEFPLGIQNCVFYNSAQTNDYFGIPEGLHLWDLMIDYVFIVEAMKSFDQRLGNGFMVLPIDMNASVDEENGAKDAIRNVRTEVGLTVRQDKNNPLKPEWLSPQPGSDFVEHLTKYEEMFATGMEFPLRWLKGDPQGAVESGQSDQDQIQVRLQQIFQKYVPFIKAVLKYHNLITENDDIQILPGLSLEFSDLQEAQVDQLKTETINMKAWLTNNEKRELDGYAGLEESEEQKLLGGPLQDQQGLDQDGQAKAKQPAGAKADTYTQIAELFQKLPVRNIADITGLAPGTVSRIRSKFDDEGQMHCKTDSWDLKCDSLVNDVLEVDGPLLTPSTLQYEDSNIPDEIPKEAIEEWFQSNTPKEIHIGITPSDDHQSSIPLEVLRDSSVGTAKAERLENGSVIAKYKISLKEVDKVLGADNWVRDYIKENKALPLSIARWSKDRIIGNKRVNTALDVRSVVLTRNPRNPTTKANIN